MVIITSQKIQTADLSSICKKISDIVSSARNVRFSAEENDVFSADL